MQRFRYLLSIALFLLPVMVLAAPSFQAGKDYEMIKTTGAADPQPMAKGKVKVIEFFSYGCPWCNRLEPVLEKWLANKPAGVDFERVPVTFESSWDLLAKAYYTADALGVSAQITPAIFKAIHVDNKPLDSEALLADFFLRHGVSKPDFESAFNFSPGIDAKLQRGNALMRNYSVMSVPTIVVAGKYKTNTALVNGDAQKMLQVVDYLVSLAANNGQR